MAELGDDGVVAVVGASAGRRMLACGVMYALGGLLIYVALVEPPHILLLIMVLGIAAFVLLVGERLRRATRHQIILTADGLVDDHGTVLVALEDVVSIDRGAFAFKPSNGFTLRLTRKHPRGWAPGVWWRFGRFLGVGGAVSAGQAKFMAEQIALALAQRAAKDNLD